MHRERFVHAFAKLPKHKQAGFFVWPSLAGSEMSVEEARLFAHHAPSGCVLFKRNFSSISQGRDLIAQIKQSVALGRASHAKDKIWGAPFIVSIDEEGGRVSRFPAPIPRGQPALSFGDSQDLEGLRSQVLMQSGMAHILGVNCILAPVADILTEPSNPAMGDRCFGRTPEVVTQCMMQVLDTLENQGILSCVKHFPGHGDTLTDSHRTFARTPVTLETLRRREWMPFRAAFSEGIRLCMTAHVIVEAVDPSRPATLSPSLLQHHLREELGFSGLVLSDDLRMNAIAEHYGVKTEIQQSSAIGEIGAEVVQTDDSYLGKAAIEALKAGCDIILSCLSIEREKIIFEAIMAEIDKDVIFAQACAHKAWRIQKELSSQR